MNYVVVFDAAQNGYRPGVGLLIGSIFVCIGTVFFLCRRSFRGVLKVWFPIFFFGFSVSWTIAFLALTWTDYYKLSSALSESRCQVVEGTITQFHPMPVGGHDVESFVVSGKRFEYSDWTITSAFHQSSTYGGPLREGMRARIYFLRDDIARIEIARETI